MLMTQSGHSYSRFAAMRCIYRLGFSESGVFLASILPCQFAAGFGQMESV